MCDKHVKSAKDGNNLTVKGHLFDQRKIVTLKSHTSLAMLFQQVSKGQIEQTLFVDFETATAIDCMLNQLSLNCNFTTACLSQRVQVHR